MLNTTPTTAISDRAGTPERERLAVVARRFPELTRQEFVAALQDATAAAERNVLRPH